MIVNGDVFMYHKTLPPRRITSTEERDALRKEGWAENYLRQDYPKVLHHPTKPPQTVETPAAAAALLKKGYREAPTKVCDYTLEEFVALGYESADYPPFGTTARDVPLEDEMEQLAAEKATADQASAAEDRALLIKELASALKPSK